MSKRIIRKRAIRPARLEAKSRQLERALERIERRLIRMETRLCRMAVLQNLKVCE